MKKPDRRPTPSDERTVAPFPGRWRRGLAWIRAFDLRDFWWRLLDRWETSRTLRRTLYALLAFVVFLAVLGFVVYPWWTRRNSIKIAREWLATGHYKYAVEAVQQAMKVAPKSPEPWTIAAELARLGGQKEAAVDYAGHASSLAPGNSDLLIAWATEALRADQPKQAQQILTQVPVEVLAASAQAQRLLGELARRQVRLTAAKQHFETALRLDGPGAIDEVPLGLILLNATNPAERQHGLDLLARWTADREWGPVALRLLLQDALARDDRAGMLKWGETLRQNPGCTVGDMPKCLLALSRADEGRFGEVLAGLEKDHAVSPDAATQLLSWLNQIGRGAEAVRWIKTLPAPATQRPPLAVAGAEALRQVGDWPALEAWTLGKDWGPDAEFLRWAYGLHAARMLGDKAGAEDLWRTLYSHAQLNGVHALFAGSTLFSWGLVTEAEALWWRAAAQEGQLAIDALGSLARLYQEQRDAEGQYRVFRQLHLLRPQDPAIGNNFAFFAALTGREQHAGEEVARANLTADPRNPVYTATYAFTLLMEQRASESLAVLKPVAADATTSPGVAFAYGLALAATGHQAEAKTLLEKLDPGTLTGTERELIKHALGD